MGQVETTPTLTRNPLSVLLRHCRLARSLVAGVGVALALAGCTASWQAPLETRGDGRRPASGTHGQKARNATVYRVRRGDTLYGIAWNAGTDWRTLAAWNDLEFPYTIVPGQELRLTPPHRAPAPRRPEPPRTTPRPAQPSATPPVPSPKPTAQPPPKPKPAPPPAVKNAGPLQWTWPTAGRVIATFSNDDPARKGIKVAGVAGQMITAAEAGRVVYSGSGLIGYGRLIIIKHNDKYLSAYGHNRKLLVKEGDQVTKGERIAEMGQSNSGQAMLHFEIRREGKPVDPMALLPRRR